MAQKTQDIFVAELREDFGKGYARRLRSAGRVPAVIYGHGQEPVHISLNLHAVTLAVRSPNALINVSIDGKQQLTIVKDLQRHPVRRSVDHLDLLIVQAGEKISVDVPVVVVGEPQPGAMVQLEINAIAIEAEVTHLPTEVEVNVEAKAIGAHITAGDIELPYAVSLVTEPNALVVVLSEPQDDNTSATVETAETTEAKANDKEDTKE